MPDLKPADQPWFGVRCVLHHHERAAYEERITLWQAADFDQAIERSEAEARGYSSDLLDTEYTGLAQAYRLAAPPGDGAEIFSLIRDSSLTADAYLSTFFDTGAERQHVE